MGWLTSPKKMCWNSSPQLGMGPYLEIRFLQIQLVKMRSDHRRVGPPSSMTSIFIRRGKFGHKERCRKNIMWWWKQRLSDNPYKRKNSKGCWQTTKAWGGKEGFSPAGFRRSVVLLTAWLQISSLQNHESKFLWFKASCLKSIVCYMEAPGSSGVLHYGEPSKLHGRCSAAPWLLKQCILPGAPGWLN